MYSRAFVLLLAGVLFHSLYRVGMLGLLSPAWHLLLYPAEAHTLVPQVPCTPLGRLLLLWLCSTRGHAVQLEVRWKCSLGDLYPAPGALTLTTSSFSVLYSNFLSQEHAYVTCTS